MPFVYSEGWAHGVNGQPQLSASLYPNSERDVIIDYDLLGIRDILDLRNITPQGVSDRIQGFGVDYGIGLILTLRWKSPNDNRLEIHPTTQEATVFQNRLDAILDGEYRTDSPNTSFESVFAGSGRPLIIQYGNETPAAVGHFPNETERKLWYTWAWQHAKHMQDNYPWVKLMGPCYSGGGGVLAYNYGDLVSDKQKKNWIGQRDVVNFTLATPGYQSTKTDGTLETAYGWNHAALDYFGVNFHGIDAADFDKRHQAYLDYILTVDPTPSPTFVATEFSCSSNPNRDKPQLIKRVMRDAWKAAVDAEFDIICLSPVVPAASFSNEKFVWQAGLKNQDSDGNWEKNEPYYSQQRDQCQCSRTKLGL